MSPQHLVTTNIPLPDFLFIYIDKISKDQEQENEQGNWHLNPPVLPIN